MNVNISILVSWPQAKLDELVAALGIRGKVKAPGTAKQKAFAVAVEFGVSVSDFGQVLQQYFPSISLLLPHSMVTDISLAKGGASARPSSSFRRRRR